MRHKIKLGIASLLTALLIPLFLFNALLYNEQFYVRHFQKSNIYQQIPKADSVTGQILMFFNGRSNLTTDLLTYAEKSHLADVKRIFGALQWIMYSLIGLLALMFYFIVRDVKTKKERKGFLSRYFLITGVMLLIIPVLSALALLNFSSSFQGMHQILFPQGNYEFPADSTLIKLFPGEFFIDFMRQIAINIALIACILIATGYLLRR